MVNQYKKIINIYFKIEKCKLEVWQTFETICGGFNLVTNLGYYQSKLWAPNFFRRTLWWDYGTDAHNEAGEEKWKLKQRDPSRVYMHF